MKDWKGSGGIEFLSIQYSEYSFTQIQKHSKMVITSTDTERGISFPLSLKKHFKCLSPGILHVDMLAQPSAPASCLQETPYHPTECPKLPPLSLSRSAPFSPEKPNSPSPWSHDILIHCGQGILSSLALILNQSTSLSIKHGTLVTMPLLSNITKTSLEE